MSGEMSCGDVDDDDDDAWRLLQQQCRGIYQ